MLVLIQHLLQNGDGMVLGCVTVHTGLCVVVFLFFFLYLVSVWLVHLSVRMRSHMCRQGAGGRPLCHSPSVCLISLRQDASLSAKMPVLVGYLLSDPPISHLNGGITHRHVGNL